MHKNILIMLVLLAWPLAAAPGVAQSAAELLEKGIYLEETAGQLEQAIEVYRRITGDATADRAHVAEALLRLGLCHLEQGDATAATAALERVVADYPEQKALVARAREHLPGDPEPLELIPAPWDDGEVLRLGLELASGTPIGVLLLTADATELEDVPLWRLRTRHRVLSDADNQGIREVLARRDTMAPVRGTVKHSMAGHFEGRYGDGAVTIETPSAGTRREKLDGPTFDSEELFHLFRRLPLEVGYTTRLSFLSTMAGGATAVDVEVAGVETIAVPAGEFECYRLEVSVPQVFWFSTDPSRVLVKFETSGIVGKLREVYVQEPGREVAYANEPLGFSVTLPPDWLFNSDGAYPTEVVFLLDPNAEAQARVDVRSAVEEVGDCFYQGGAQDKLEQAKTALRDYTLRDGSWREWYFGGWPAVSFAGDYRDRDIPKVHYWTLIQNEEFCVDFTLKVAADRFDALRAVFDRVIESYRAPPPPPPEDSKSTVAEAVDAVLAEFHFAAADLDRGRFFEHLAPDAIFFGTGAADRFEVNELRARFEDAARWLGEAHDRRVVVSDDGTLAWFDQRLETSGLGELRASGVLRLAGGSAGGGPEGSWQIVQYHAAMPVPNQLVPELVEKLHAHDQQAGQPVDFSAPVEAPDVPTGSARWLLHDVHLAKAAGDGDRYFGHFAPDAVFLGTDRAERFSVAGLRAILGPYYARGARPVTIPIEQQVYLSPDGGWAWYEELVERKGVGRMRGTGVLRRVEGAWKIVHYNVVLTVPGALAEDFAERIEAFYSPETGPGEPTR